MRLSLDLPEDATCIRTTRLLSRSLLQEMKVVTLIIDDVETIVAELCSNVTRHAESKATHFVITLEYFKLRIIITVTDEGRGFIAENIPLPGTSRPDGVGGERYGGFGMTLLQGLSDKIDFTATAPHGTTVRVEKNLRYETEADADKACARDI